MTKNFFTTSVGRLRLLAFLEGTSLLVLVFIAVPVKHIIGNPSLVRVIGPIHGALFLLFVFQTMGVAIEQRWKFQAITWKILLACLIPFGTFYIDRSILSKLSKDEKNLMI
jgi:integral membrane protein